MLQEHIIHKRQRCPYKAKPKASFAYKRPRRTCTTRINRDRLVLPFPVYSIPRYYVSPHCIFIRFESVDSVGVIANQLLLLPLKPPLQIRPFCNARRMRPTSFQLTQSMLLLISITVTAVLPVHQSKHPLSECSPRVNSGYRLCSRDRVNHMDTIV